ncbi:hypothetical protein [Phenylobacterium sp.]|uniref:hypothetical protein n=1 Tax=Phenylobacterium sp. TaxID=1871053 RepID=UPI00374CB03D
MSEPDTAAGIEVLAVALYESDCRERAGDMARRTTLSRIRAHYAFPSWMNLPPRERDAWRAKAQKMLDEQAAWRADEAQWDGPGQGH